MRYFFILLALVLFVSTSYATTDPDPNQIGVYFDTTADMTCMNAPASVPFNAYVIITNPTSSGVWGVEFSLYTSSPPGYEGMVFRFVDNWPVECPRPIDLEYRDWWTDGLCYGCSTPIPQVDSNVIVLGIQYMLLANFQLEFYLGPFSSQSIEDGLPSYVGEGGEIIPLGYSVGDPSSPVAVVNGECSVISVEPLSFDSVKCLFR